MELSAVRAQNDPIRIGVYRHYTHTDQNPKYYQVLTLARFTETEEILVIYVPLYPAGGIRTAARPLKKFLEPASVDGKKVERFTYIGTEIPQFSV